MTLMMTGGAVGVPTCWVLDMDRLYENHTQSSSQLQFDLKPDNILVHGDANGPLLYKVADFGLSKAQDSISDVSELRYGYWYC